MMNQGYEAFNTSDENSGRKLTLIAGLENPSEDIDENSNSNTDKLVSSQTVPVVYARTNHLAHRQMSSERSPLIRPRRPTDTTEDTASSPENSDAGLARHSSRTRYGTSTIPVRRLGPPTERPTFKSRLCDMLTQPVSTIVVLLLILVVGIVLEFAANLNTDHYAVQVEPIHVKWYLIFLIVIFITWTVYPFIRRKRKSKDVAEYAALIPSHLLTGICIFGVFSASTQILLFVDFMKCRRHVENLSFVYALYPFFKILFVYCQVYFFYKLSRNGIQSHNLPAGSLFVMTTLATNLCIWATIFFTDASADPKLADVSWLNHYHYGIEGFDHCANANLTSPNSRELHALTESLSPYISTFSMEYALLASGLLLHIWMVVIKGPTSRESKPCKKQPWTLWRFGFILGLLSIPVIFVAYMKEQTALKFATPKIILYGLKAMFFIGLVIPCLRLLKMINERHGFCKKGESMKLEVVLLGISAFVGFPVFDFASVFAAVCEWENFPIEEVIWSVLCSVCELISVAVQFFFIKKAYQYKLPRSTENNPTVKNASHTIRQYASFALVVNIAHWAAHTYELRRSSSNISMAEKFFGRYTWFTLSHFTLPLCIFFYFHLAICYANVVFSFSQFENQSDDEDEE